MRWLWLIPVLPLAAFAVLALVGRRLPRRLVNLLALAPAGLAAGLALVMLWQLARGEAGAAVVQRYATWLAAGGLSVDIAFRLDGLSGVMLGVVTFVGFLILLYSTRYMAGDEGYSRFFAYMNLFIASMLVLVLADDLLLLYAGWEGVGLCSYLLIGFWYRDQANGAAARKAFWVTRIGDTALAIGLFILVQQLGTLNIAALQQKAAAAWPVGSTLAIAVAALLLAGAVGKSAQLPLQTWLPDAMAGPTPTSALIHAATMVAAGVYLIARLGELFLLAPPVMALTAGIGALTLLLAGGAALVQTDIKRVLAYSTISQIGYMFLALGVGAFSAAIFHLMTHAFFKSLLFLAAGAVILALHRRQDLREMGGLRRPMPLVFWTFLAGAASLSALPLVTAGFYSKDAIVLAAWASPRGGHWLWAAGVVGALLTSLYAFRLVFRVFFGPLRHEPEHRSVLAVNVPLVVLAALSLVGGFVQTPELLGDRAASLLGVRAFGGFVGASVPPNPLPEHVPGELGTPTAMHCGRGPLALSAATTAASLLGLAAAWWLFLRRPASLERLAALPAIRSLADWGRAGWGFDTFYDLLLVVPFVWMARFLRGDPADLVYRVLAGIVRLGHVLASLTQSGRVRWYAVGVAVGAILLLLLAVWR